jgi:hypothetical protein
VHELSPADQNAAKRYEVQQTKGTVVCKICLEELYVRENQLVRKWKISR